MIVPVQILEKLKCSNCENLLSCGPVLLKQDGTDICGRCSNLEETAVPNKPYNSLAVICMFPCKYEAEGCYKKISFSYMKQHEADCEFRTYICPVMPSGSCEWIGSRSKILEHTREMHPEKILEHPCEMEHDVKTVNLKTFLTTVFDVLFLIQVKICLKKYTIYHSVRKIGEISKKHVFKYQMNIENENGNLMRKGDVASQGCLALQEDSALAVEINSLMQALNGFNNTKFTITLQEYMKCYICKTIKTADQIEVRDKISKIFSCKTCSLTLHSCVNTSQGCTWKGKNEDLHQLLFCTYTKRCDICKNNIEEMSMLDHMRNKQHHDLDHLFGKYQSVCKGTKIAITLSYKNQSNFLLYLKNKNLSTYTFHIEGRYDDTKINFVLILRNPNTKHVLHYNTIKRYDFHQLKFIWILNLHYDKLEPFIHNNQFEMGVDIYSYE